MSFNDFHFCMFDLFGCVLYIPRLGAFLERFGVAGELQVLFSSDRSRDTTTPLPLFTVFQNINEVRRILNHATLVDDESDGVGGCGGI